MSYRLWLTALGFCLVPGLALAHPGSAAHDALHGFLHPLTGIDHILAMVSVGMLAAQRGGRALWVLPLAFVLMMAAGGALGMSGTPLWGTETAISLSVIVLGLCIMAGFTIPIVAATGLIGLFALFHGYAHGAEMPATASGLVYGLSFMAATALLHALGIGLYLAVFRRAGTPVTRAAGGLIALAGAVLLIGVI